MKLVAKFFCLAALALTAFPGEGSEPRLCKETPGAKVELDCYGADKKICQALDELGLSHTGESGINPRVFLSKCLTEGGPLCGVLEPFFTKMVTAADRSREYWLETGAPPGCLDCPTTCENMACCCWDFCDCIAVFWCNPTIHMVCCECGGSWTPCGWHMDLENPGVCVVRCFTCS